MKNFLSSEANETIKTKIDKFSKLNWFKPEYI